MYMYMDDLVEVAAAVDLRAPKDVYIYIYI